jgi:hypothetical protein
MPFADARELATHFGRYPPAHVAASILCRWPSERSQGEMTDDDFRNMRGPIGG